MGYVVRDIEVVRGTTPTIAFRFKRGETGSETPIPADGARLSVYKDKGKTLAFRADMELTDEDNGEWSYQLTAAQSRGLTMSKDENDEARNKYEVELREGADEEVYVLGTIRGTGGLNDDIGA